MVVVFADRVVWNLCTVGLFVLGHPYIYSLLSPVRHSALCTFSSSLLCTGFAEFSETAKDEQGCKEGLTASDRTMCPCDAKVT
jgi:hypothetical protein